MRGDADPGAGPCLAAPTLKSERRSAACAFSAISLRKAVFFSLVGSRTVPRTLRNRGVDGRAATGEPRPGREREREGERE